MFHSARIKLTAWYLLIIMVISISFSFTIYNMLSHELNRVNRIQRLRALNRIRNPANPLFQQGIIPNNLNLDTDLIEETRNRLIVMLILANIAILTASTTAGYFLAGKTLEPIQNMVDEQKRFITDASHELRTPLTSLKTEIEVHLRDKNLNLEEVKNLLLSNLEEVNSLQKLTDKLIKLTQFEKGSNGLTVTKIALGDMSTKAIKKLAGFAKSKKVQIVNNIENTKIEGDETSLVELFVILLDNAIKYSPANSKIILESKKSTANVEISVEDQGQGIRPEEIKHLFDRFYRTDKSRAKNEAPGYGLGLAIAKQIAQKHKGTMHVQSKIGKGSKFTVIIPRKHTEKIT